MVRSLNTALHSANHATTARLEALSRGLILRAMRMVARMENPSMPPKDASRTWSGASFSA